MKTPIAAFLALLVAVLIVACENRPGTQGNETADSQPRLQFGLVIYDSPGNPFWTKVQNGAREMADKLGCEVTIQYAEGDSVKQNDIIEQFLVRKLDGIGVVLNYDESYDGVVSKAIERGVPVIAFNIDDTQRGAGNARMAYIGQDMEAAGYIIAKRLIAEAGLKKGDFVLCPVETPGAVYAVQRYAGAKRAFDEVGIESEVLETGAVSLEETLSRITQFLLGHPEVTAILGMGGMPLEMAPRAAADAKRPDLPNAGFDLSKAIARNIQEGRTIAAVDQQPFYQGALTVMMLHYNRRYGLLPCDVNTGGGVIDKSNVEAVLDLADTIR